MYYRILCTRKPSFRIENCERDVPPPHTKNISSQSSRTTKKNYNTHILYCIRKLQLKKRGQRKMNRIVRTSVLILIQFQSIFGFSVKINPVHITRTFGASTKLQNQLGTGSVSGLQPYGTNILFLGILHTILERTTYFHAYPSCIHLRAYLIEMP